MGYNMEHGETWTAWGCDAPTTQSDTLALDWLAVQAVCDVAMSLQVAVILSGQRVLIDCPKAEAVARFVAARKSVSERALDAIEKGEGEPK